jgi:hypothetical protein
VGVWSVWPRPTSTAWAIIGIFGGFEALLQLCLPGKEVYGPVSPAGNTPVYKASGNSTKLAFMEWSGFKRAKGGAPGLREFWGLWRF